MEMEDLPMIAPANKVRDAQKPDQGYRPGRPRFHGFDESDILYIIEQMGDPEFIFWEPPQESNKYKGRYGELIPFPEYDDDDSITFYDLYFDVNPDLVRGFVGGAYNVTVTEFKIDGGVEGTAKYFDDHDINVLYEKENEGDLVRKLAADVPFAVKQDALTDKVTQGEEDVKGKKSVRGIPAVQKTKEHYQERLDKLRAEKNAKIDEIRKEETARRQEAVKKEKAAKWEKVEDTTQVYRERLAKLRKEKNEIIEKIQKLETEKRSEMRKKEKAAKWEKADQIEREYREKIENLRAKQREKIEEIRKEEAALREEVRKQEKAAKWEKVEETKERYRGIIEKQRGKRSDTAVRGKIKALHKELSDILLKPKEGRYVPKELVKTTADMLAAIDTTSGRAVKAKAAMAELKVKYDALAKDPKYALSYDETVSGMIQQIAEELGGDISI